MYLWNVIKRFRETETIVALNNSFVHKIIPWCDQNSIFQDWAGIEPKYFHFFSLYLQLTQQQLGPNSTQFRLPTPSSRQKLTFYIATLGWPL